MLSTLSSFNIFYVSRNLWHLTLSLVTWITVVRYQSSETRIVGNLNPVEHPVDDSILLSHGLIDNVHEIGNMFRVFIETRVEVRENEKEHEQLGECFQARVFL